MNRSKKSWKLLVLVALVSSFIFCSEVCADNCVKDAKAAQKEEIDLIAMTTHGRSGVSRWVYGGVANRIVEESLQPVLLIRPAMPK